ncbi:hypothetical protein CSC17_5911 (plasmid) [Klebsiella oxytoca]|nr:hypothetical protein CSC17_5911 [Klebsiella oxytoca]
MIALFANVSCPASWMIDMQEDRLSGLTGKKYIIIGLAIMCCSFL